MEGNIKVFEDDRVLYMEVHDAANHTKVENCLQRADHWC